MSYQDPKNNSTHLHTREARAGRRVKGMTIVLGLSTLAAIILLALVFAGYVQV